MRATGLTRRIDDLGRIIIPKEIRRTMGIRDGEVFEIFIEGQDTICFRKREPNLIGEINHLLDQIEVYGELPYETQERVGALLDEVRELVKGEE